MIKTKRRKVEKYKSVDQLLDAIGIQNDGLSDAASDPKYSDKYKIKGSEDVWYFIPDEDLFSPLGKPKKGDWLSENKESGQTYKRYITGPRAGPTSRRNTIYLLPVVINEDVIPSEVLEPLRQYAARFYAMRVKCLKVCNMQGKVAGRMNGGVYQAHAGEILDAMEKLPGDAFCVAAITMCDIYPRDESNFAFGYAKLAGNCGVYSLARYLSSFGDGPYTQINLDKDPIATILVRACKTMCHEIGHMFGLRHCIFYNCLMNGSNHLEESDSRSNFNCPVCLRKLQFMCKFDIVARYQVMKEFWAQHGLKQQTDWLEMRIARLSQ